MKSKKIIKIFLLTTCLISILGFNLNLARASSAWDDAMNWTEENLLGGNSNGTTSFTEFKGGLSAPSTEGYAEGLTKATDARKFVINVTNFALGFLGLIAIIIVIYGGFMYVLSGGNEEQSGKGKKAVMYAVIGIIIILGSFAIVNTVLKAPGGSDQLRASPEGSSENGQLNINYMAMEIKQMAKDLIRGYVQHWDTIKSLQGIKADIDAGVANLENCKSNGCGDNWSDGLESNLNTTVQYFSQAASKLTSLKGTLPTDNIYDIGIRNSIDSLITAINAAINNGNTAAWSKAVENGCDDDPLKSCSGGENPAVFAAFYDQGAANLADKYKSTYSAVTKRYSGIINKSKNKLALYYNTIQQKITTFQELENSFNTLITLTDPKFPKNQLLAGEYDLSALAGTLKDLDDSILGRTDAIGAGDTGKNIPETADDAVTKSLSTVIQDLGSLYDQILTLKFMSVRLEASVVQGNAPLTVNFSSVGSVDPTGKTIDPSQIQWDLDGNSGVSGDQGFNEGDLQGKDRVANCKESANKQQGYITTTCTYTIPGTYIVKLRINPTTDEKDVIAGETSLQINVNPPQTKVNLEVKAEGQDLWVSKYDDNGIVTDNRSQIVVPFSSASSSGVQFIASATQTADGAFYNQANDGATVYWDFGDGSVDAVNKAVIQATKSNLDQTHVYVQQGTYTVTVEFSDKNKVTDRKIFNLIVADIAPVIDMSATNAMVGDEVLFNGSNSRSDYGPIKEYLWSFDNNLKLDDQVAGQDKFSYKFENPGKYKITLKINDGNKDATTSEWIYVNSKPPVSQFSYEIPDPTQPATVVLDGKLSYDPDGPKTKLKYRWEIDGTELDENNSNGSTTVCSYNTTDAQKPTVTFNKPGTYTATLVAIDEQGGGTGVIQESTAFEKEITIDKTIDIAWDGKGVSAAPLATSPSGESVAKLDFGIASKNAVAYEIDFGDGEIAKGDMTGTVTVSHEYKEAGTFLVQATVFDAEDKDNSIKKKVYITSGDKPAAVIGLTINSKPILDTIEPVSINRTDLITFDANSSINVDGTGRKLTYSWDLGDGEKSTKDKVNHTYKEIGDYTITLKVTNSENVSQNAMENIKLSVRGEYPFLRSLTAVPAPGSTITPVSVNVNAVGAEDPDGKVVSYRWWYYDPNNDEDQLGVQVTTGPTAIITIGTRGEEGQEKQYKFAVEMTDNENNTVISTDILPDSFVPVVSVVNGPNKAPIVKFTVDKTSIFAGESINFAANAVDPDGTITEYYWDWEGDGFANNNKSEGSSVTHVFNTAAPDGIRVKLKVVDNNESEAVSDPVIIYVDSVAKDSTADFTFEQVDGTKKVKFTNKSESDTANKVEITKYSWDFDVNKDANGDGIKDNDLQSTEKDPEFEFADYGIYRSRLTIEDSEKRTAVSTEFVNVKAPATTQGAATALDARVLSNPEPSQKDGKIHILGDNGSVTFDFSSSVGNIKQYIIDKNVNFDSNGNGIKDDDEDYKIGVGGKWTTTYTKAATAIRMRLAVIDANNKKDTVEKDIVFDPITK